MAGSALSLSTRRRMKQYLVFRLLINVLSFLLVTFYVTCLTPAIKEATCIYLYSLLGFHLLIGIVSFTTFAKWSRLWFVFRLQILVDFTFQALLVWSTGGVLSIFTPVVFVTLAAAAGVYSARGAFLLATTATLFLGGATLMHALGVIPATSSWSTWVFTGEKSTFIVSYLIASVLGLYVISTLGSKLSSGLQRAEHLQEEIIENIAEGLLALDENVKVVHLNGEARKLLGLPGVARDYRKRPFRELLSDSTHSSQNENPWRELYRAFVFGRKKRFETNLVDQQGVTRPVEVKISSVLDDKGRCRCRIGLFADLSLKREIEAAERRIQKLEELQVMATGIAHEIRNPLASIRGCVQELSRGNSRESDQGRYAKIVMRESDRLDRIIEEFLRYARSAPPDLKPLDLVSTIEQAVLLLKSRPEFRSRTIAWEPPATRVQVYGDPDHLLQVFLNLGINALQATSDDDGLLEVEVESKSTSNWSRQEHTEEEEEAQGVEIQFRDNGRGMEPEDAHKVFTPFFTTKTDGSGLGLSVVERYVREHNGLVGVESSPHHGTTVRIWLPVLKSAVPRDAVRSGHDERGDPEKRRERAFESTAVTVEAPCQEEVACHV